MDIKFSYKWLMIAMAIVGSGCVSTRQVDTSDSDGYANRLIADKVSVAADAQREFVAIIAEDKAILGRKQATFDADEIDVDYIGKPQQLLETFAHRYGFKYVETGKRIELNTVNVKVKKTSPVEILRNIGNQIDFGANIVLDKDTYTLRLVYKGVEQNGYSR